MKTTLLSFSALFCVSLSYAQEFFLNKTTQPTFVGSFGTMKFETQTAPTIKSDVTLPVVTNDVQYTHSSIKTSDGGTVNFVKFNTKRSTPPIKESTTLKDIPKTINKEDIFKMSVYPNPAMTEINIVIQDGNAQTQDEKYTVRIKNLMGQNIFEQKFEGKQSRIDVSKFAKGFFLIEVSNSKGEVCHTEKVVIQ